MNARVLSLLAAISAAVLSAGELRAGDAAADWEAIVALDAGPREHPATQDAARAMVIAHLAKQEKALRAFIAAHPDDSHAFEAKLRLARLYLTRGNFEGSEKLRAEGGRMLAELEKSATPEQSAELDFAKLAQRMRTLKRPTETERDSLLAAARNFQSAHPGDRRIPALLTEVATLFDGQPKTKEALLTDAQVLATDPELKGRIADDLKRIALLGTQIELNFTSVTGKKVSLADFRGKPVVLIFFADFSVPSSDAITNVQRAVADAPLSSVEVVGVSLDNKREQLAAELNAHPFAWTVVCDLRSWESPLVRPFGINAIPTVWLLDRQGRLRSLNGLEGLTGKLRQLLAEGK